MIQSKKILFGILLTLCCAALHAQIPLESNIIIRGKSFSENDSATKLFVKQIHISGAKKTKLYIILREIQFKKGDTLLAGNLHDELLHARRQIYNTTLFNEVLVEATIENDRDISIEIIIKERWYLYPVPLFQLVDRNFNVWAKTYKYNFDRVNYGLKFTHYNFSGRKDLLNINLLNGYSRNFSFSYTAPYSNSALSEGFTIGGGMTQNREIAYKTSKNNTQLFYPVDSLSKAQSTFVRSSWYINAGYIMRKGLFVKHVFSASYAHLKVSDSVVKKYNPSYFNSPDNSKGILDLMYSFQYSNVDNVMYALNGTSAFVALIKRGLGFSGGINMTALEAGVNKYYPLGKHWYSGFQLNGKIKIPFAQAYINRRGLGYGDSYLRGLEYYVVDGVATALLRSSLKKKIISFSIPFNLFPKVINKIPVTIFAKTYADLGYAYLPKSLQGDLNNRLLYTGGFGIDILTLYDVNLRLEYSFNQYGQNGLFFHAQSGF